MKKYNILLVFIILIIHSNNSTANDEGCDVCDPKVGFLNKKDAGCEQDKNKYPKGSYRQSCDSCCSNGNTMTCHCKRLDNGDPNGGWNDGTKGSSLPTIDINLCPNGIANSNGNLVCDGSYLQSCDHCKVENNILTCDCGYYGFSCDPQGEANTTCIVGPPCADLVNNRGNCPHPNNKWAWKTTKIDLKTCPSKKIYNNQNGDLTCEPTVAQIEQARETLIKSTTNIALLSQFALFASSFQQNPIPLKNFIKGLTPEQKSTLKNAIQGNQNALDTLNKASQ